MKLYKRIGENGFEHIVQAESDEVAAHMGLFPYQAETKERKPANKAGRGATKAAKPEPKE